MGTFWETHFINPSEVRSKRKVRNKFRTLNLKDETGRDPQREILSPLEASLDHLWATLFHLLLQMGKGWLFGKLSHGKQQPQNTLMEIVSQGKNWIQFDDSGMP